MSTCKCATDAKNSLSQCCWLKSKKKYVSQRKFMLIYLFVFLFLFSLGKPWTDDCLPFWITGKSAGFPNPGVCEYYHSILSLYQLARGSSQSGEREFFVLFCFVFKWVLAFRGSRSGTGLAVGTVCAKLSSSGEQVPELQCLGIMHRKLALHAACNSKWELVLQ